MKLVGGDNGYYEKERVVENLIIAPAERSIVDISALKEGTYPILHTGNGKPLSLGTITVSGSVMDSSNVKRFAELASHDILGDLSGTLDSFLTKAPDKSLTLAMTMNGMEGMNTMHMMGNTNMMD